MNVTENLITTEDFSCCHRATSFDISIAKRILAKVGHYIGDTDFPVVEVTKIQNGTRTCKFEVYFWKMLL